MELFKTKNYYELKKRSRIIKEKKGRKISKKNQENARKTKKR